MLFSQSDDPRTDEEDAVLAFGYLRDRALRIICDVVARHYGLKPAALRGPNKSRRAFHVRARRALVYVVRTRVGMSYPAIGEWMQQDHATVINAFTAAYREIGRDVEFAAEIAWIEREVALRAPPRPEEKEHGRGEETEEEARREEP